MVLANQNMNSKSEVGKSIKIQQKIPSLSDYKDGGKEVAAIKQPIPLVKKLNLDYLIKESQPQKKESQAQNHSADSNTSDHYSREPIRVGAKLNQDYM